MPTTAASMRTSYPALFTSTTVFPSTYLDEMIAAAELMTAADRWPSTAWYDLSILYKAAELALRGIRSFTFGAAAGSGAVQSMSTLIGSVSYDLKSTTPAALARAFASQYTNLARLTMPPIAISG